MEARTQHSTPYTLPRTTRNLAHQNINLLLLGGQTSERNVLIPLEEIGHPVAFTAVGPAVVSPKSAD